MVVVKSGFSMYIFFKNSSYFSAVSFPTQLADIEVFWIAIMQKIKSAVTLVVNRFYVSSKPINPDTTTVLTKQGSDSNVRGTSKTCTEGDMINWLRDRSAEISGPANQIWAAKTALHGVTPSDSSLPNIKKCMEGPDSLTQFQEASAKPEGSEREGALFLWAIKRVFECSTEEVNKLPVDPEAYPIPLTKDSYQQLLTTPSAALLVYKDNCFPCHFKHEKHMRMAGRLTTLDVYTAEISVARDLLPPSVEEMIDGTPFFFFVQGGTFLPLSSEDKQALWSQVSQNKYTGSNSKVGFGKETPRNGSPERMTIAERQGMSEENHFEEKSTPQKPTFESRAV